jgi:hypothetical protein
MGTSWAAPMNALKQAFKNLNAAFKKSLELYSKTEPAEASNSVRLPTLDHQLTGPLLQYKFPWNKVNKDPSACPCCGHSLTMPVKLQAKMNAKNHKQRTKASANGGDEKFNAVSAIHGCYAYFHNCCGHVAGFGCKECERKVAKSVVAWERGPGVCGFDCKAYACDCWCVFQEHKIRRGLRSKGNLKHSSNPSPAEMGAMVWTQFILTEIENRNVHEHQHVNDRTSHELLQDISSLASYDAYRDPLMASDANVTRGLHKKILLSAPSQYCCTDETTKPMTLAQAMAAEKHWGEEVSIDDHIPTVADFLHNSNSSNHRITTIWLLRLPQLQPYPWPLA